MRLPALVLVFAAALHAHRPAPETGAETIVQPGSRADGKTLRDLRFETETGMFVLAIQRGARWVYRPRGVFTLLAGDRLISVGPDEGEDELIELCGEQPEPETD